MFALRFLLFFLSMYFLMVIWERNSNMRCDFWDCSTIRYPPWPSNLDRRTESDRVYTVWPTCPFDGAHAFARWCLALEIWVGV